MGTRTQGTAKTHPLLVVGLLAGLSAGCSHAPAPASQTSRADAVSERGLREALEERDRRIAKLESRMALLEAEARQIRRTLAAQRRPPLRETVRIGGAAPERGPDAEQGQESERPVLRLHAQERARRHSARPAKLPEVPHITERLPVAPLPPSDVEQLTAETEGPADAYRRALDLVRKRDFDRALSALNAFLVRHPGDSRTARVLFWRGEVQFALSDCRGAVASFLGALETAPAGRQAADALLKLHLCHRDLGDPGAAQTALEQLKARFPHSEAARLVSQEDAS